MSGTKKPAEKWSLSDLLQALHNDVQESLATARKTLKHPVSKGDASEYIWLELFKEYLPERYQAITAHVVDSRGDFSEQIDVLIFDRRYAPFIFKFKGELVVPAEGVYAVFEAKQEITSGLIDYAHKKVASVRKLHRTSLPISTASGKISPIALPHILGGFLALESKWKPPLGKTLSKALNTAATVDEGRLDLGCVASHGIFCCEIGCDFDLMPRGRAVTAFLFELITRLQELGPTPAIDLKAYAEWLDK